MREEKRMTRPVGSWRIGKQLSLQGAQRGKAGNSRFQMSCYSSENVIYVYVRVLPTDLNLHWGYFV